MSSPRKCRQPIDPLLQQRPHQTGGQRGTPLPPPASGAQQPASAQPTSDAAARIAALAAARGAGKVGRRAKPARAAKLSALALSAVSTIGLAGLFASQSGSTDSIQLTDGTSGNLLITVAPATTTEPTTAATTAPTVAEQATIVATDTPTTVAMTIASTTGVLDGTYVGESDSNRWGNVQVQVVYAGGLITDVQILQYPDGDRKSISINQHALPTLISEAIGVQSAQVSTVSGATYTTDSYVVSLQSAIDAALAASGISG